MSQLVYLTFTLEEARALLHAAGAGGLAGDHYDRLDLFNDDLAMIDLAVAAYDRMEREVAMAQCAKEHDEKQQPASRRPKLVRTHGGQRGERKHPRKNQSQQAKPHQGTPQAGAADDTGETQ